MPLVSALAVPSARLSLTYCPSIPPTLNTAYGDPSLTVTLVTVSGRSSFGKAPASAASTTGVVGTVTVGTVPATGADSSVPAVLGSSVTNTVPVPSSLMVPIPITSTPLEFVTTNLNVSPLSSLTSLVIRVRTNSVPVLSRLTEPVT